jgi:type VI secretion system ImpC/EvpB family protein
MAHQFLSPAWGDSRRGQGDGRGGIGRYLEIGNGSALLFVEAELARQGLVKTLVEQALVGTVTFDRNLPLTIDKAIAAIDARLSAQLNEVMHHPDFQRLEGTWRGLHYLVHQSETGENLKIRVLNVTKDELFKDLEKASEFDQSTLFKKIYEAEYGQLGGKPYGMLVGEHGRRVRRRWSRAIGTASSS